MATTQPSAAQPLVSPKNGIITTAWLQWLSALGQGSSSSSTAFGVINVKDFGATGNGVTDDSGAINAAISAAQVQGAGSIVFFPLGTYAISSVISISGTPVRLVGSGMGEGAYGAIPATSGTRIKYIGTATAFPVISFTGLQSSAGLAHMTIDANLLADVGLQVDTCTYGLYVDIEITSGVKYCMIVRCTSATGPSCSWNEFRQIALDVFGASAIAALWTTGNLNTNTCHNTFKGFRINHSNTSNGINLGYCDNNRFEGIYISSSGTGFGVNLIDTEHAGFPVGNYFWHLQAGNGWFQAATSNAWNVIIGYDRSNGQPAPVTNNKPLLWLDGWGAFNSLIGGGSGAAGGADIRTNLQTSSGSGATFAQIISGYQGTSANYYDAEIHHFRDHAQANDTTIQAGVLSIPKYVATNGTATRFGKTFASVAANATVSVIGGASGLYIIRELSDGGVALVLFDQGLVSVTIVSDPAARFATVDPGAGGNKIFLSSSGANFQMTNRFAAAKGLALCCTTFFATPS